MTLNDLRPRVGREGRPDLRSGKSRCPPGVHLSGRNRRPGERKGQAFHGIHQPGAWPVPVRIAVHQEDAGRQVEQEASAGTPDAALLPRLTQVLADTFSCIDAYLGRAAEASAAAESWCQVRQTVLMLELAAAQIHVAMRDSSLSVEALMGAFTTMVERLQGLEARIRINQQDEELGDGVHQVSAAMDEALMALQFYDRLAQRLEHVEHGLGHLAELLASPERVASPPAWSGLQEEIRSRYTTEEERIMFAAVMGGMPVAEAIAHYKETVLTRTGNDGSSEVELF